MKINIDRLYIKYKQKYSSDDPVWFLHNFTSEKDIEVMGLIASCYSYGQIGVFKKFIEEFLNRIDNEPFEYVMKYKYKNEKKRLSGMDYRFNNANDLMNLIENIRVNILKYGSLLNLFLVKYSEDDENILNALKYFSGSMRKKYVSNLKGYDYLVPDVSKGSTSKRLNLFLRWMVRKDEIDLGIWSREVDKSKLIMPVDTHVYRVSREMKLVERNTCDMKYAIELTEKLKEYDPADPVKYDFALCHNDI
ncbi:MAG: TIGR02757 family protein [Ignavibacteria bacterium]